MPIPLLTRVSPVDLVIDQHETILDAHLVGMRTGRHAKAGERPAVLGIAHINDRGPVRTAHMTDVGNAIDDHDLTAAGAIEIADLP